MAEQNMHIAMLHSGIHYNRLHVFKAHKKIACRQYSSKKATPKINNIIIQNKIFMNPHSIQVIVDMQVNVISNFRLMWK